MSFRSLVFWVHLGAGLAAGLAIGVMCFTGTLLAFEKELVAWSERDARVIPPPPPDATRLPIGRLQETLQQSHPGARPTGLVVSRDPHAALAFTAGRSASYYANPYTGEIRQPASTALSRFMRTMTDWHRSLGFTGETSRPRGKLVNGVANVVFCLLALTGLYLWLPRTWSWRAVRPAIWFRQNASAKARDFNWHNAIGFWCAPVLIVLTLTALPISFRWAGNLIVTLTGTPPSAPGSPGAGAPAVVLPPPPPGAMPLAPEALIAAAQAQVPDWKTITLRLGDGERGRSATAPAAQVTVRENASWPRTATTTLTLDPYRGEVLRRAGYAELNAAQQVRAWTRFLHTGEAVGAPGQFLAGVACLGGVFLVYTGFALSWRRFFSRSDAAGGAKPAASRPEPGALARP
jgi:uncharacterized iron-regulated membrane protein